MNELVVFSEDELEATSDVSQDVRRIAEAARMQGLRVFSIPSDFAECEGAANALGLLRTFDQPVPAVWLGYIPSGDRYRELFEAAAHKNVRLVNTPEESQRAMDFALSYPHLQGLTPKSAWIREISEIDELEKAIPFPLFVKGGVKSDKEKGWAACVANNHEELRHLVDGILANGSRSRGVVVARELVHLRKGAEPAKGFPRGREYRAFVFRNRLLALGWYWDGCTDPYGLTEADKGQIHSLIVEASKRLGVPYVAIDVAQLESGRWIVMETGDAQFCGVSTVSPTNLWNQLTEVLRDEPEASE